MTQVTHCAEENLAASSKSPAKTGQSQVETRGSRALKSITAIKLRSRALSATAGGPLARAAQTGDSPCENSCRRRLRGSFRQNIIPCLRSLDPQRGNGPAALPRAAGKFRYLPENAYDNPELPGAARDHAKLAPAACFTRRAGRLAAHMPRPSIAVSAPAAGAARAASFIPIQIKSAGPAVAKTTHAIAPPARRVNVGLTVNRDDHVTKIPVVFASEPPHSQESKNADTGR
jgi:hypothetical protein